ncbi:HhH-GPD-type base excision DNA repair protein [Frankia sp. CiP3]|uniref:HhH-GPD-type base excision DNA repair protein n=1 Tax=Frankia sp. CiP3 TaxID=2880971 RepID=UPI0035B22FD0
MRRLPRSGYGDVVGLHLSQIAEADELLTNDPLALLIGMVLDQQIPLERAFAAPCELARRLGRSLNAADLARADPDELGAAFSQQPALHRFPGSMAKRVQSMCQLIVDTYDGNAARVWTTAADGKELLRRVAALPGFGTQKAKIFVALLGKQLGVTPPGWREVSAPFGDDGSYLSIADIIDTVTRDKVRAYKKAMKAAAKAQAV